MSILKQAQRAIAQLLLLLISLCSHVQAQDTGQVTGHGTPLISRAWRSPFGALHSPRKPINKAVTK
ncbi:MAG: hypothetical protein NTV12_02985 [Verrucomicrobia bacterium]|nr:hypothetical protein [Verrucomicrobiota bacterium]